MKRTLLIAVMVCALPALANAVPARLKTWAQTPGGYIETSLNAGFKHTSAYGARYYNYSSPQATDPTVTVTAQPGYVATEFVSGSCSGAAGSYMCPNGGEVIAYFEYAPTMATVTAAAGTGGSVNIKALKNLYIGQTLLNSIKFVFRPNAGGTVNAITLTVGGVPVAIPNAQILVTGGTVSNPAKTVTFLAGYAVTGNIALAGTFNTPAGGAAPTVNAPKTVLVNETALLTASPAGGTWSRQGGPSVYNAVLLKNVPQGAVDAAGNVTGLTVAGIYYFKYSVNGTYATTSVIVANSAEEAMANSCTGCHDANGVGAGISTVFPASQHATAGMVCATCHVGANTGGHPGTVSANTVCIGCHVDPNGDVPGHLFAIGGNSCVSCHDPHTTAPVRMALAPPHRNDITSGMYPASYVTSRATCADCHSSAADNAAIRTVWGGSGHADTQALPWIAADFKTLDGCVRCHTTTGYINYITLTDFTNMAAWGQPADKTKEVLACNGCHNPDSSRRSVPLVGKTFTCSFEVDDGATVSSSYQYSGSYWTDSTSNVCMPCHTGTTNGEIIKQAATFANFTAAGRLTNHGMAAGGMIGKVVAVGYNYDETTYQNKHNTWHYYIGIGNARGTGTSGPCIACHMSIPGQQHSFAAVTVDADGAITGLAQAICDGCHPSLYVAGPMDVAILTNRKAGFADALAALKAQLQKSGFDPDRAAPVNWGATSHIRANNMGAYYNYFLLRDGDKGAYVHGPAYTKRLIIASLDWLDDNTFNSSVYATLQLLATEGRISPATRDSVRLYLDLGPGDTKTGYCLNCHAY